MSPASLLNPMPHTLNPKPIGLYAVAEAVVDEPPAYVVTAYPAEALLEDEMLLIKAKEQQLLAAGWAAEQEPRPTLPHPCNAFAGEGCPVASVVPTAQAVPESALVKCKNCNAWFRYANNSSSRFSVY